MLTAVGGLAISATVAAAGTSGAGVSASALPKVDMERVVLASQLDPPKSGTGKTPEAGDDVLRVERALKAKGLLASRYVDGHYGSSTVTAYGKYQRRLGYSGIDANGIPGRTSLNKLGSKRFAVVRTTNPGSRNYSISGERVNHRTYNMIKRADSKLSFSIRLTQGSYTSSNPNSAGTHAGGGAVDISVSGLSSTNRWRMVRELRRVGFAAWLRTPSQGDWGYHIHAIAVNDTDAS
ncbi:MAG: peptidoglycan-binding domain-containing protein, partial [Micromonosporaceae bacterium]